MVISPVNAQLFTILVGEETTQGVEATTIDKLLGYAQSVTPNDEFEPIEVYTGGSQAMQHALQGENLVSLELEAWLYNAQIFKYLMGTLDTTGSDPWTHDFSFANTVDYLTAEVIATDVGSSRKYLGCKVDEVKLAGTMNEPIKLSASLVGMELEGEDTPQSVSVPSLRPFTMVDAGLTIDSIDQVGKIHSFELTSSRNLAPVPSGGQKKRSAVVETKRTHELIAELVIEDHELFTLLLAGTEFAVSLAFVRTASSDQITISAAKCKIFKQEHPLNIDDEYQRVTVPITIIGDFTTEAIDLNTTY